MSILKIESMNANELRIGNKLDLYGTVATLQKVDFYNDYKNYSKQRLSRFKPIPLTEEWLLKFGFEKVIQKSENFDVDFIHYQNEDCWIYLIEKGFELELNISDDRCNLFRSWKHVHQLQNLYFALTGKELKIK